MEEIAAESLFKNLLPLEALSLQEIVNAGREKELSELDDVSDTSQGVDSRLRPVDHDTVTSPKAQLVRAVKDLPVTSSQQSCYFLSKDHKDWSVESKIVMCSKLEHVLQREPDQSGHAKQWVRISASSSATSDRMPDNLEQNGRPNHCDGVTQDATATSLDDPSSEPHSVKGVFVAAVASLHETGFAVKRAVSRLREMQTTKYLKAHAAKWQRWPEMVP